MPFVPGWSKSVSLLTPMGWPITKGEIRNQHWSTDLHHPDMAAVDDDIRLLRPIRPKPLGNIDRLVNGYEGLS